MPFRLRLFSEDQMLVATDHDSPEEVGRQAGMFPLDELMDSGSGAASVRREVVFIDDSGTERAATAEEDQAVFWAQVERMNELREQETPPCQRCGLKRAEHPEPLFPMRAHPDGPIYFACWTDAERDDLPSAFQS